MVHVSAHRPSKIIPAAEGEQTALVIILLLKRGGAQGWGRYKPLTQTDPLGLTLVFPWHPSSRALQDVYRWCLEMKFSGGFGSEWLDLMI